MEEVVAEQVVSEVVVAELVVSEDSPAEDGEMPGVDLLQLVYVASVQHANGFGVSTKKDH